MTKASSRKKSYISCAVGTDRLNCRYLAALDMKCAAMQLAAAAQEYSRRVAAALRLQAATRGWLGRRQARVLREEAARRVADRAATEAAARAIIRPWATTFRDRAHFLRLRCGADGRL